MERPTGISVLAILAFGGALVSALIGVYNAVLWRITGASRMETLAPSVLFSMVAGLLAVAGLGLWQLRNWARIFTLVVAALGLLFFGYGLILSRVTAHEVPLVIFLPLLSIYGCAVVLLGWTIRYMFRPHVKKAFGKGAAPQ